MAQDTPSNRPATGQNGLTHPRNTTAETGHAPELDNGAAWPTDEARQAGHIYDDFRQTGTPRVNVLLVGPDAVTRSAVTLLVRDREEPLASWRPGEPFVVPAVRPGGTVVVHNVDALPHADQLRLLEWLDEAAGQTHVISTTPRSLLPDVLAGSFNDTLFYRLNTVCFTATE